MLSRLFLIKQGQCCGLECLMCPYENKHSGKSCKIRKKVWEKLNNFEKEELKQII